MKKLIVLAAAFCVVGGAAMADAGQDRVQASRAAVKEFFGNLKGQLVEGLKSGGPAHAIEICNQVAPGIAADMSDKTGWDVGRTSLKLRNPKNAPDAWEEAVLKTFDQRRAAGENPKKMEYSEVVEQDGEKVFRYMKAIPTAEKPCLACHGKSIKPEVAAKLDELYPNDQARGYEAGEIRGAFTITQPMD